MTIDLTQAAMLIGEVNKQALINVLEEMDELIASIDNAMAIPAIAQTKAGTAMQQAKDQIVVMARSALIAALRDGYGIEHPLPEVDPMGRLVIPPKALSKLEFAELLTDQELGGLMVAADEDPRIGFFLFKFNLAQDIRLDDARTIAGVEMLEAAGYIGQGRADEILKRPVGTFTPPAQEPVEAEPTATGAES